MQSLQCSGNWELIKSVGEGGFGEVQHWRNRLTREEIATKSLKANHKLMPDEVEVLKRRWIQEYQWMKSLSTPFIVHAIEVNDNEFLQYLQEKNHLKMLPVIIMEYCNGGDLRHLLQSIENMNGLVELEVRGILKTLRYAVEYLHQQCNIEHRDIKPENIVIHNAGGKSIYKLTDFGYAREIPERTIAQSVVGTRHYVAPEVIDPGAYTKTVDYWSVGVLAFEITCGFRPFLPHKEFRLILTNILKKPKKCIAITQYDPQAKDFNFEERISWQNNCSPIFNGQIENWLALALDGNYKERGYEGDQLQFYNRLDSILQKNILSVYSLPTCQFFYYDINLFSDSLEMFFSTLSNDTKIPMSKMYAVLPPQHPKKTLANIKSPRDCYVPEWLDTKDPHNPPVMLYVSNYEQCDYHVNSNELYKNVPKVIDICMSIDEMEYDEVPIWLLEQFERQVHFLLSDQKRNVDCHMKALFQKIAQMEEEVFMCQPKIDHIHEWTILLCGRAHQFLKTVEIFRREHNPEKMPNAQKFLNDSSALKEKVSTNVVKRYKSVLSHCKQISSNNIFNSLPQKYISKLECFRRHLSEKYKLSNSKRMKKCTREFDSWAQDLKNFPKNVELKEIHYQIQKQYEIFRKLFTTVCDIEKYIKDFETKLDEETSNLLKRMTVNDDLSSKLKSFRIDESAISNGFHSNSDMFDPNVAQLIEDTNNLLCSFQTLMEIDEVPTTVKEL